MYGQSERITKSRRFQHLRISRQRLDIKGNTIVVYSLNQSVEEFAQLLKGLNPLIGGTKVREFFARSVQYSPMLQFILEDAQCRLFTAQRYCFIGSVDDWIDIGHGPLTTLVKTCVQHLEKESYFELF